MDLSLKIAWRNILRHKRKSLVIGIIMFVGALVMTVGNGVISGMDRGLKENIMNRFTGNILVIAKNQEEDNVFLSMAGKDVQVLPRYPEIKKLLEKQEYVSAFLPMGKGVVMVLSEEEDPDFTSLLGVSFQDYYTFFHKNVIPVEGTLLKKDDRGVLISEKSRKRMYDFQNMWVVPAGLGLDEAHLTPEARENKKTLSVRDNVLFMGSSEANTTLDIRTSVRGIIKFEYLNDYWGHFNIIDIESFREAFNYVASSEDAKKITPTQKKILESENLDDLFGGEVVKKIDSGSRNYNVAGIIGNKVVRKKTDVDSGAYNLVVVKLKDSDAIERGKERLSAAIEKAGLPARVITWKQSIGLLADMATFIRSALFVFVFMIFFVAIIIIMNTLTMTAMERINEIGMMRAVGAQRSFVGRMFFMETSVLSLIFGSMGIVIGLITIAVLNAMNIRTENEVLQLLYGGNVFKPVIDLLDIVIGFVELVLVTVLAALYPMRVAGRITPLEAIARD